MDQNQKLYKDKYDIINKARGLKGKSFKDLNFSLSKHKGTIGDQVESWFGLEKNNESIADFKAMGIDLELKTTPIKKVRGNKYSAKERLVLGKINFHEILEEESFSKSHIFEKIKETLIVNYLHDSNNKMASTFLSSWLLNLTEEELKIIEGDFKLIKNKVISGNAHILSSSDTTYLEATTKGKGKGELVSQPNSSTKASPRAFALKTGFMTRRTREFYGQTIPIARTRDELLNFVKIEFDKFIGKTANEILVDLKRVPQNGKSTHANAIKYMLNSLNLSQDDFDQLSIIFKTQKKNKAGKIQESMSFPNMDLNSIKNTDFEQTEVFVALSNGVFLNVFSHDMKYEGSRLLSFNVDKIETARSVFDDFKKFIGTDNEFMPKLKLDKVIHVRNKDKNSKVKRITIDGKEYPNLCWWINKNELL